MASIGLDSSHYRIVPLGHVMPKNVGWFRGVFYRTKEALFEAEKLAFEKECEEKINLRKMLESHMSEKQKKERHNSRECVAFGGCIPYSKADGECPTCKRPTVGGRSQWTCYYSALTCKTCSHNECEGGCYGPD